MIPVWASVPCKKFDETFITEAIKEWFLAQPAEACISKDEFDAYVHLYQLQDDQYELFFEEHELSPVDHALVIFYETSEMEGELRVFGAVPYAKLGEKFFLQELWKYQSTEFVPPYMQETEPEVELFYWHCSLGSGLEKAMEKVELEYADSLPKMQEAIIARINWYFAKGPCLPKYTFAREDKIAFMLIRLLIYRIINLPFPEAPEFAGLMSSLQMEAENFLLRYRLQAFTSEKALFKLFRHNYANIRADTLTVEATPLDHKWFMNHFPSARYMPVIFLKVPIEDYPGILPKYEGGFVHVPFYWEAIANWLIHKNTSDMQRSFLAHATQPIENVEDAPGDDVYHLKEFLSRQGWHEWERQLLLKMTDRLCKLKKFQTSQGRFLNTKLRIKLHSVDTTHGDPIINEMDIEDLGNLLPPCCRPAGRFPTNMQRVRLTQVLWNGGFTYDGIVAYMSHLNNKFPKNPPESLERRFRVEDAIKTYHADIHHCGNVINDTIKNTPDRIKCPFVVINQREKVADCKQACRQVTGLMTYKYDPHEVIAFNIAKYKGSSEPRAKKVKDEDDWTKIKVPDFGDSISDEEEEEEIEEEIYQLRERNKTKGISFFYIVHAYSFFCQQEINFV